MAMAWAIGIGLFLFLLLVFPRRTMGLTALCGVALGGFLLWTKMKNDERDRKRATIVVTVVHDLEQCSPEVPFHLIRIRISLVQASPRYRSPVTILAWLTKRGNGGHILYKPVTRYTGNDPSP